MRRAPNANHRQADRASSRECAWTIQGRAAGYRTAYLTCCYFDDDPRGIDSGMHCRVRTELDGVTQDGDIAHFKKAGRADVAPVLNPIPGKRFTLAHGRDHVYRWGGIGIRLPTPSRPLWVRKDGSTVWGKGPAVQLIHDTPERSSP